MQNKKHYLIQGAAGNIASTISGPSGEERRDVSLEIRLGDVISGLEIVMNILLSRSISEESFTVAENYSVMKNLCLSSIGKEFHTCGELFCDDEVVFD